MWPQTVPILTPRDISSRVHELDRIPQCIGSHLVRLYSPDPFLSEVWVGAIAKVHQYLLVSKHIYSTREERSAVVWNLTAAYLGYTKGQDRYILTLLKAIKP